MESHGVPGRVCAAERAHGWLKEYEDLAFEAYDDAEVSEAHSDKIVAADISSAPKRSQSREEVPKAHSVSEFARQCSGGVHTTNRPDLRMDEETSSPRPELPTVEDVTMH